VHNTYTIKTLNKCKKP